MCQTSMDDQWIVRLLNSREWNFHVEFHRKLIRMMGNTEWEAERFRHNLVTARLFDELTIRLDEGYPNGMPEEMLAERRELSIKIRIQQYQLMIWIQDCYREELEIERARQVEKLREKLRQQHLRNPNV